MRMIAAAIAMFGFGVSMAEAMPIAPVNGIAAKNTVLVDYACGRGYHLTRWGNCRPNWNRPPPPRYGWRNDRRPYGWGGPPRYGWRYERSYGWDRPPPWVRGRDWR